MATVQQLESALRKADAAGNVDDARALAAEIRRLRGTQQPKADFSGVTATASSTEAAPDYGPLGIVGVSADEFRRNMQQLRGPGTDAEIARQVSQSVMLGRRAAFQDAPTIARVAAGAGSRINAMATGLGQLAGLTDEAGVARERERSAHMADDTAYKVGEVAGDVGLMLAPGGAVSRVASLPGRVAANSALGAAYGGVQPVADGESRGANAAIGGLAGALGQAIGEGAGALARGAASRLDPIRQRAIEFAREQDIPLHITQLSQSLPVRAAGSMAKYLPFSGAGRAAQNQQAAFNRAVGRTFGAEADQLSDDVVKGARKRLSSQFEDIYNRNDVAVGEAGLRRLVGVETDVGKRLTSQEREIVRNQMDSILDELNDFGALTGQKYQALRTQIMKAEGPDKVGAAVGELRKTLDDIAATAVGPEDSALLRTLRGQWANLRTTENLLKQVAGAGGDIKPAAIWPAIRKGSTPEMRELGRLGQTILKDSIPDSGTPGRAIATTLMAGGGLTGGPAALPGLAALLLGGAAAGRALNSPMAARLLGQQPVASGMRALARTAPAAGVAATPVVAEERRRRNRRNGK